MSTEFINDQWRLPNEENKTKVSNYSMSFDGTSSKIDFGNVNIFERTDAFSGSCWVYLRGSSVNEYIISKQSNTNLKGYVFYINSTRKLGFIISRDNSINIAQVLTTSNMPNNTWTHIAFTYDGSSTRAGIKLYINSVLQTLNYYGDSNITGSIVDASLPFQVSGRGGITTNAVNGKIDAVSIYNYELSPSQITTLYGSSSTGIGNPMSLSPAPVAYYPLGDQDAFNGADYLVPNSSLKDYVFDFSGGSVSTSSTYSGLDGANKLTISFWAKSTSAVTSVPISIGTSPNRQIYIAFFSSGRIMFIKNQNGDATYLRADSGSPHDGNWNHILISMDLTASPSGSIYFNGNNITLFNTLDTNAIQTSTGSLLVGDSANFVGNIAQLAIWSGTDLRNDVATIYNNGSPNDLNNNGLTAPTTWYKLDASATYDSSTTTWSIPDDSTNSNTGTSSGMTQANLVQSDLSFTSGYSPYALDFDGTNNYIDVSTIISDLQTLNSGTLSFWIKPTTISGTQTVLGYGNTTTTADFFSVSTLTGGKLRLLFRNDSSGTAWPTNGVDLRSNASVITTNNWYHICVISDGSSYTVYLNGSAVSMNVDAGSNSGKWFGDISGATMNKTFIGAKESSSSISNYFDGFISNVSIWNTDLTSAQVTEIYNEGVPSNLNNHSAYSNLISWWQLGSNSSFNSSLNQWTCIDEKGTNTGESSQTFNEDAIVDGVGSYANGLSSGMGGDEVIGDAPYSTANSLSVNMDVEDRVTDTPS